MEDLRLGKQRPDFLTFMFKYIKIWLHGPIYNYEYVDEITSESLRYLGNPNAFEASLLSEILKTLASKLNLTLEHVATSEQGVRDFVLDDPGNYFEEEAADLTVYPTQMLSPLNLTDSSKYAFSIPFDEGHEIEGLVPKHEIGKSVFAFISTLTAANWFDYFLALLIYGCLHGNLLSNRRKNRFLDGFILFLRLTLSQSSKMKPSILITFWLLLISFCLNYIFKSTLLKKLAFDKYDWPRDFHQLTTEADNYKIYVRSISLQFFENSDNSDLKLLAKKVKPVQTYNILAILLMMSDMKTAFVSKSADIDTISSLFNKNKYSVLKDRYVRSQYLFLISKKFAFWKRSVRIIQFFVEAGFTKVAERPAVIMPLAMRVTDPRVLLEFLEFQDSPELSFRDMKGVFYILLFGNCFAFVFWYVSRMIAFLD